LLCRDDLQRILSATAGAATLANAHCRLRERMRYTLRSARGVGAMVEKGRQRRPPLIKHPRMV
jgi:hypothetical protein